MMERLKQLMAKGILVATVILSGLFASHTAYAEQDFYVYILNSTSEPITVQLIEDNCWHRQDFASPVTIDQGKLKCMKTETSRTGWCWFNNNKWMEFRIYSSTNNYGNFKLDMPQYPDGYYWWAIKSDRYGLLLKKTDDINFEITIK